MKFERLGNIVEIIGGNAAPKGDNAFGNEGLPFVKMKDLGDRHLTNNLIEIENLVSDSVAKKNRLKVVKKGSILLPRSGSVGLNHRAILGVDAYMVSHICALEIKNVREVLNQYLYYYLTTINFNSITKKTTGLDAITFQDLAKVVVPLPSLFDQLHIANILSRAENLIAQRKESIRLLDEYLKSTFLEMFGNPVSNKKDWALLTVLEIGDSRLGKMLDGKKIIGNNLKPYLRNSNVLWFNFKLDDLLEMDFDEKDRLEFTLKFGDILMCEGGEIGRCAIWKNELKECYFQKAIHRIRLNRELALPEYFVYMFWLYASQGGLKKFMGAATISHLTGEKLKKMKLPIPPIELQNQFFNIVEKTEVLKTQYQNSLQELENLYGSLSQRAFKGELNAKDEEMLMAAEPQEDYITKQ